MCCNIDTTAGFIEIWKWFVCGCLFAVFDFILFGRIGEWWWEFLPKVFWKRIKWISFARFHNCKKKWKNINEIRVGKNRLVLWNINYRRKTKNKINQIKCELCENKMVSENENWYFFFFCLQFAAGMENEMATKWDSFRERCELGFMFKKNKMITVRSKIQQ